MRRTLPEECEAQARHSDWIRHHQGFSDKDPPKPGYKDCYNCPLRAQVETEEERRSLCSECPWYQYPDGPTVEYLLAESLSGLPDYFLSRLDLTDREHRNIAFLRSYQNERREMERLNMIGRMLVG